VREQKRSCKDRRALHRDSRRASSRFIREFNRHLKHWNEEWKGLSPEQKASYQPFCPRPRSGPLKRTNCYVYFIRQKIEEGILDEVQTPHFTNVKIVSYLRSLRLAESIMFCRPSVCLSRQHTDRDSRGAASDAASEHLGPRIDILVTLLDEKGLE